MVCGVSWRCDECVDLVNLASECHTGCIRLHDMDSGIHSTRIACLLDSLKRLLSKELSWVQLYTGLRGLGLAECTDLVGMVGGLADVSYAEELVQRRLLIWC